MECKLPQGKGENKLSFENVDKLNDGRTNVPAQSKFVSQKQDLYDLSLQNWMQYFYQYRRYITFFVIIIPVILFNLFQNKNYQAHIGFKVEVGQDFTSNILSESITGISNPNQGIGNMTERALIKAQSRDFYQELATIVFENKDYEYIRYKFLLEKKSWLVFVKKLLLMPSDNDVNKDNSLEKISELLEKTIYVKGDKENNNIYFEAITKNEQLSKEIQLLLKRNAGGLMINRPLSEAKNALKILREREKDIFAEIDAVDAQILGVQKQFNTLLPEELLKRYTVLRLEIDKQIFQNQVKINELQEKKTALLKDINRIRFQDSDLQYKIDDVNKELKAAQSNRQLLKQKLKNMSKEYDNLPLLSSEISKFELKKNILLEKLKNITQQISVANISYQKVKNSLKDLNTKEQIIVTSSFKVLFKTLFISFFLVGFIFVFYYYKQIFFPLVMKKEELFSTNINIVSSFSRGRFSGKDKYSYEHLHPRNLALTELYKNHMKGKKIFLFSSLSHKFSHNYDMTDVFETTLRKGLKIKVIDLGTDLCKKRVVKKMKKKYPEKIVSHSLHKRTRQELVNKNYVKDLINHHEYADVVFILAPHISEKPDALMLAKYVDQTFIFSKLYGIPLADVNKFNLKFDQLPQALRQKFSIVLTNALPYDDIELIIKSEQDQQVKRQHDYFKKAI